MRAGNWISESRMSQAPVLKKTGVSGTIRVARTYRHGSSVAKAERLSRCLH